MSNWYETGRAEKIDDCGIADSQLLCLASRDIEIINRQ
jgi:hypothetical protein